MDGHRPALSPAPGAAATLLLAAPPAVFLGVFFAWPVLSILIEGVAPAGQIDLVPLLQTWTASWAIDAALFTVALATSSTLLTLLVGVPAAAVFARYRFPARGLLRALFTVPFVLPTIVVADREGKIVYRVTGIAGAADIERAVERAGAA